MKPWSLSVAALFALAVAACAGTATPALPAAPPPVDPVGTFEFNTPVDGQVLYGTIVIDKTETGYAGSLTSTATGQARITAVLVAGQKVTVNVSTADGPLAVVMDFQGDDFTGTWTLGSMSGTHTGKRRKS